MASTRVDIVRDQKIIPRIMIRTMVSQERPQNYLFLSEEQHRYANINIFFQNR